MRSSASHFLRLVHSHSRIGNESCRVLMGINNIIRAKISNWKVKTVIAVRSCYLQDLNCDSLFRNFWQKHPNMPRESIKNKQAYQRSLLRFRDTGTSLCARVHQAKEGQLMQGRVNQQISSSEEIIPCSEHDLGPCRIGVAANKDSLLICHTHFCWKTQRILS